MATEPHVVNVHVADAEPLRSFINGVTEAAGMFATLGEGEQDALPDAALFGIARLRGAIAELTGEEPPQPAAERLPGLLVIEWPAPRRVLPCFAEVAAYRLDADYAERQMTGVTSLTLHVSPDGLTATAETLVDEDGEPVGPGAVTAAKDESGEYKTAVFRYVVAGMRVREPVRPAASARPSG